MASNKLKLNNDKTELLDISSKYQLCRPSLDGISLGGYRIGPSNSPRNIGVVFDQIACRICGQVRGFSFAKHC